MIEINWHYSDEDCDRIALGITRGLSQFSRSENGTVPLD
jgi:hypothetical protein